MPQRTAEPPVSPSSPSRRSPRSPQHRASQQAHLADFAYIQRERILTGWGEMRIRAALLSILGQNPLPRCQNPPRRRPVTPPRTPAVAMLFSCQLQVQRALFSPHKNPHKLQRKPTVGSLVTLTRATDEPLEALGAAAWRGLLGFGKPKAKNWGPPSRPHPHLSSTGRVALGGRCQATSEAKRSRHLGFREQCLHLLC